MRARVAQGAAAAHLICWWAELSPLCEAALFALVTSKRRPPVICHLTIHTGSHLPIHPLTHTERERERLRTVRLYPESASMSDAPIYRSFRLKSHSNHLLIRSPLGRKKPDLDKLPSTRDAEFGYGKPSGNNGRLGKIGEHKGPG